MKCLRKTKELRREGKQKTKEKPNGTPNSAYQSRIGRFVEPAEFSLGVVT